MYDYTIFPLELLLKSLLFVLNDVTHNYVFALMLLSVLVRCMTTPLEKYANTIVANEQALQDIFSPQLATIKETYSGSEKHSAIQRLYARYSYHPIFAIRGTVGLLVQLPFFFAAFMMIGNLPELKGYVVPFLGDLGKPDGLLAGINLLPFVMTAINIVAVYTLPNQTCKGRRQAVILALLFLVLLYAEPSALVVYWTTNNLLSLGKNFWKRLDKYSFIVNKNNLPKLFFNRSFGIFLCIIEITCFAIAFKSFLELGLVPGRSTFYAVFFMMVPVLGNYLYRLTLSRQSLSSVMVMSLIGCLPFLYIFKIHIVGMFLSTVVISVSYAVFSRERFGYSRYTKIALLIGCYMSFLCVVVNPLNIFNSDPEQFGRVDFQTVLLGIVIWCACSFLIFTVARLHKYFAGGMFVSAIILTCYTYMLPLKLGVFRGIYFTNDEFLLNESLLQSIGEVVILILLVSVGACCYRKMERNILPIISISLVAICIDAGMLFCDARNVAATGDDCSVVVKNFPPPIPFSKKGKNIVFVVPDATKGAQLAEVFREYPEFSNSFSGFTFFPNTVASGPSTLTNTAAVIGGGQFTLPCLQEDLKKTLLEKMESAYLLRRDALEANGYDSRLFNLHYVRKASVENNSTAVFNYQDFLPYLKTLDEFKVPKVAFEHKMIALLASFRMSPVIVKRKLYKSKFWKKSLVTRRNNLFVRHAEDELFLRLLPQLSTVEDKDGAHFTQIWSSLTHYPFVYDRDRNIIDHGKRDVISPQYESLVLFLRDMEKWIAWMKEHGVYDNTKIIFVSDHGSGVNEPWNVGASNAVLMVKEFDASQQPMKTNNILMSNSDAAYFVMSNFKERTLSEPEKFQSEDRTLKYYVTNGWADNQLEIPLFEILKRYEITGDVADVSKWQLKEN